MNKKEKRLLSEKDLENINKDEICIGTAGFRNYRYEVYFHPKYTDKWMCYDLKYNEIWHKCRFKKNIIEYIDEMIKRYINKNEKQELIERIEEIFDDCCKSANDDEKKLLLSHLQDLRAMFEKMWEKE